jgi:hypothetical protein
VEDSWRVTSPMRPISPGTNRISTTTTMMNQWTQRGYVVRGSGENVRVTYLTQLEGLVYETVTLPWTSAEFEGPDEFIRSEADGPAGTRVKCSVRYRRIEGTYGGNGSGTSSQWANRPDEDQTRCALDLVQIP